MHAYIHDSHYKQSKAVSNLSLKTNERQQSKQESNVRQAIKRKHASQAYTYKQTSNQQTNQHTNDANESLLKLYTYTLQCLEVQITFIFITVKRYFRTFKFIPKSSDLPFFL